MKNHPVKVSDLKKKKKKIQDKEAKNMKKIKIKHNIRINYQRSSADSVQCRMLHCVAFVLFYFVPKLMHKTQTYVQWDYGDAHPSLWRLIYVSFSERRFATTGTLFNYST